MRARLTRPPAVRLGCATAPTDRRRGFDGLAARVRSHLPADPLSGQRFVFLNRKADRLQVLYGDRDGLCLWYKRREQGRVPFPAADADSLELTPGQLPRLRDGVAGARVRRSQRSQRPQPA